MRKRIFAFTAVILVIISLFCGCAPLEDKIEQPSLVYDTVYPQTAQEYNIAINRKIVPALNVIEGHVAKGRDILSGSYPIDYEIDSVEDSISYLNEIYNSIKVIYPPESEQERHADTLMQYQRAINSVEVYYETLCETTDLSDLTQSENIEKCIGVMQSEYTSLKNMFNVATG